MQIATIQDGLTAVRNGHLRLVLSNVDVADALKLRYQLHLEGYDAQLKMEQDYAVMLVCAAPSRSLYFEYRANGQMMLHSRSVYKRDNVCTEIKADLEALRAVLKSAGISLGPGGGIPF